MFRINKELKMCDNDYCENCDGTCDGCCGGSNKKFQSKEKQAEEMVKMIMSHGYIMANLVLKELEKQILIKDK